MSYSGVYPGIKNLVVRHARGGQMLLILIRRWWWSCASIFSLQGSWLERGSMPSPKKMISSKTGSAKLDEQNYGLGILQFRIAKKNVEIPAILG